MRLPSRHPVRRAAFTNHARTRYELYWYCGGYLGNTEVYPTSASRQSVPDVSPLPNNPTCGTLVMILSPG